MVRALMRLGLRVLLLSALLPFAAAANTNAVAAPSQATVRTATQSASGLGQDKFTGHLEVQSPHGDFVLVSGTVVCSVGSRASPENVQLSGSTPLGTTITISLMNPSVVTIGNKSYSGTFGGSLVVGGIVRTGTLPGSSLEGSTGVPIADDFTFNEFTLPGGLTITGSVAVAYICGASGRAGAGGTVVGASCPNIKASAFVKSGFGGVTVSGARCTQADEVLQALALVGATGAPILGFTCAFKGSDVSCVDGKESIKARES